MPLPDPNESIDPFMAAAGAILDRYMNANIIIKDPKSLTTTAYNGVTDIGGEPVPVTLYTGPAMISRLRRPIRGASQTEWAVASSFSFQLPSGTPLLFVPKGMLIQVLSVNNGDQALRALSFTVTIGLSGSWAPVQLMEADAEMVGVYPQP